MEDAYGYNYDAPKKKPVGKQPKLDDKLPKQTKVKELMGPKKPEAKSKSAVVKAIGDGKRSAAAKVQSVGNNRILITERGTSFGYHDLVVDFRSFVKMREFGFPVIYDATHSLQQPSIGVQSGGLPRFIPHLARAATALCIDGIFFETHPEPAKAKSDASTQLALKNIGQFLEQIKEINYLVKKNNYDGMDFK